LVKARLQTTHPLAKPVVSCLSRLLRDFWKPWFSGAIWLAHGEYAWPKRYNLFYGNRLQLFFKNRNGIVSWPNLLPSVRSFL
jgi:hypothetical protein